MGHHRCNHISGNIWSSNKNNRRPSHRRCNSSNRCPSLRQLPHHCPSETGPHHQPPSSAGMWGLGPAGESLASALPLKVKVNPPGFRGDLVQYRSFHKEDTLSCSLTGSGLAISLLVLETSRSPTHPFRARKWNASKSLSIFAFSSQFRSIPRSSVACTFCSSLDTA